MNGLKTKEPNLCGLCKATIGKGPGLRTGIQILNFRVVLNPTDSRFAHMRGMPVKATINLCLPCMENMTNNLIRKDIQGKAELDTRDVIRKPLDLVTNPKKD